MTRLAGLMFILSGMSALIYPFSWIRFLNASVSATPLTSALIISALFGGLALGSLVAKWRLNRLFTKSSALSNSLDSIKQTLFRSVAFTQIVIAISAVGLLPVLLSADQFVTWLPNQQVESVYGFIMLLVLLLIPSAAIGASIPLLSAWQMHCKPQNGQIIRHYSLVIFGAAVAPIVTGFYLIPSLGLDGALYSAAALNLFIAILAIHIHLQNRPKAHSTAKLTKPHTHEQTHSLEQIAAQTDNQETSPKKQINHSSIPLWVLTLTTMALVGSGFIWTKFLTIYTGATLYGYSAILFTIFVGLIIGIEISRRRQAKKPANFKSLFRQLLLLFIALTLSNALLAAFPYLYSDSQFLGELLSSKDSLLMGLSLLPSSVMFGAVFSQCLALYCNRSEDSVKHFASAFAVQSIAAMLTSTLVVFWLIPEFGSADALLSLAALPLVAALFSMTQLDHHKSHLAKYVLVLSLGIGSLFIPSIHYKAVLDQHHYRYLNNTPPKKYFYLQEGATGMISLVEHGDELVKTQTNGFSKSFFHNRYPFKGNITDVLAGALPFLLQENVNNAFILGFGVGNTSRILAESDLYIVKTVEMEPRLVEGIRMGREHHFGFLEDGRVELYYNDPRASLRLDPEHYSIIISQPDSPWLAGANNFYSQEFFKEVKDHLKEDGVFAHSFSLFHVDTALFKSILNTFYSVFPQGAIFSDLSTGELILLGGKQPLVLDYARSKAYFEIDKVVQMLRYGGLRNLPELPKYYVFSSAQALETSKGAEIITDSNLLLERSIAILSEQLPSNSDDPYQLLKQTTREKFSKIQ